MGSVILMLLPVLVSFLIFFSSNFLRAICNDLNHYFNHYMYPLIFLKTVQKKKPP